MKTLSTLCGALAIGVATMAAASVSVAAYPERPIQLIIPYSPGGAGDVAGRILAKAMTDALKQTVVVENKAGAGTILGAQYVAKASPDGYTLLLSSGTTFTINPAIYPSLPYSPKEDFVPLGVLGRTAMAIVANPKTPYSNLADLVSAAKAKPDSIAYASFGIGTVSHFVAEQFQEAAGIKMMHIPYKGSAPGMTDLIGGQVPVMFDTVVAAMPQVKAGKIKALAVTTAKRSSFLPDVPTLAESGYPGFNVDTWIALFGPKGLPEDVQHTLSQAMEAALKDPATLDQLRAAGVEASFESADSLRKTIAEETPRFAEIAKRANIQAQ